MRDNALVDELRKLRGELSGVEARIANELVPEIMLGRTEDDIANQWRRGVRPNLAGLYALSDDLPNHIGVLAIFVVYLLGEHRVEIACLPKNHST